MLLIWIAVTVFSCHPLQGSAFCGNHHPEFRFAPPGAEFLRRFAASFAVKKFILPQQYNSQLFVPCKVPPRGTKLMKFTLYVLG